MIHGIGGIAIAAHPGLLPGADDPETVRRQFSDFKDIGMDGVETHYPMHSAKYFREVANLAREMNLLESGGSDYHGTVKTNRMGYGCGDQPIPASYLKPLLDRLESQCPSANGIGSVL